MDTEPSNKCTAFCAFDPSSNQRRLLLALFLCAIFMVVEFIGGYLCGSLAIMTDAAHLLSDIAGFTVSLVALTFSKKSPTRRFSYGYHRAEILGALLSLFCIWVVTAGLFNEAIQRIRKPVAIKSPLMIAIAGVGILVNLLMGTILHAPSRSSHFEQGALDNPAIHTHTNLNIRAALIHVFGDLLQSVGVFLSALIIYYKPKTVIVDPICTIVFSLIVLGSTGLLTWDISSILMEATPPSLDPDEIIRHLIDPDTTGIVSVHDLHIWSLAPGKIVASLHLVASGQKSHSEIHGICRQILRTRFHITHITMQVEQAPDICST